MPLTEAIKKEIRERVMRVVHKNTDPQLCSECGLIKPRTLAHEYRLLMADIDFCIGCDGADVIDITGNEYLF